MKRASYRKTSNAHYDARAESRPRQVWKKRKKDGTASVRFADAKNEAGAIPVHVVI
jgi:hypothetical protein